MLGRACHPRPPSMSNFVQPAAELLLLFVACHVRIAEVAAAVLRCRHGSGNSRENARNFAMLCERESECEAMVATVLPGLCPFAADFDGLVTRFPSKSYQVCKSPIEPDIWQHWAEYANVHKSKSKKELFVNLLCV